ncbi:MAG TPA: hypothetical protein VF401_02350 [Candidatus Saccharimonadales bacterium]
MARLPIPGSDDNTWGGILNDFLSVELNNDGSLKKTSQIQAAQAAADAAQTTANSAQSGLTNKADTSAIVPISTINAKGDLLVGTANDTITRLGVGTNGWVLTADSTQTSGVKWAAASGGGVPALTWTSLVLPTNAPWFSGSYTVQAYGSPYAAPAAALDAQGVVHLRGLMQIVMSGITQINAGALLATLPSSTMFSAAKKLVWSMDANTSTSGLGLAVNTDGAITATSTISSSQLPNLDSITFDTQA